MVCQAITGKNTIGTARPGNSSGNSISNGSDIEMGTITQAKESVENRKLKTTSPFCFNHFISAQYSMPASMHTSMFKPVMLVVFNILE